MRFLFIALTILPIWSQSNDWQSGVAQVSAKEKTPGSGFVVAVRGDRAFIVTCAHVVEGDPMPSVTFQAAPEERFQATVRHLQGGRMDGLALLVVDKPPSTVRALGAAKSGTIVGTPVVVAGYPASVGAFTVQPTTIVSVRGTELYLSPNTDEGFSGGPVMLGGRVAGMVFGHEAYGRAVPVSILTVYLEGLGVLWGSDASGLVAGAVRLNPKDGLKYVWIPPGTFMMGCSQNDGECTEFERPAHEVTLSSGFWLGQTEVTQAAYERLMKGNPSMFKGADRPVEQVKWNEAQTYCKAIGGRLPTEAEWEYAARAGTREGRYGVLERIAWFLNNSNGQAHPVGQKEPNDWNLFDMLGNVSEWVADLFAPYTSSNVGDPQGPASGQIHMMRGGAWYGPQYLERASARGFYNPDVWDDILGFRCVADLH